MRPPSSCLYISPLQCQQLSLPIAPCTPWHCLGLVLKVRRMSANGVTSVKGTTKAKRINDLSNRCDAQNVCLLCRSQVNALQYSIMWLQVAVVCEALTAADYHIALLNSSLQESKLPSLLQREPQ